MKLLKTTVLTMLVGMTVSCQSSSSSSDAEEEAKETIQLKGVALLATSLEKTVGTKKDIDVYDKDQASLLEKYKKNFGGAEGLSIGKTFTDTASEGNQMTGYFMSLGHLAANASAQCGALNDGYCTCDSHGAAREMLSRAVSYVDFYLEENASVVDDFAELCGENPNEAITALLASIAFAKRN